MPEPYVYPVAERPDVEVWVDDGADGAWWPAELRMRTQRADGYWYDAAWHRDGETYLDTFHERHVRPDTVDRSRGRGPVPPSPESPPGPATEQP